MPDYYNIITDVDPPIVDSIAQVLEIRAADPEQRRLLDADLAPIDFRAQARNGTHGFFVI